MIMDINEIRDRYNDIRRIEAKIHRVKTLHSLGRLPVRKAKRKLRLLEIELGAVLRSLPPVERHYYYYRRLYGHPATPAGKLRKPLRH